MLLQKLTVKNFRCHESISDLPIHKLTVFIGENDAGKTALLDALSILLTSKSPIPSDFRLLDSDNKAQEVVISGTFKIEIHDSVPPDLCSQDGENFILTKIFQERTSRCEIECFGFEDERFNSFENQDAPTQKELLTQLGLQPGSNKDKRLEQFQQAVQSDKIKRARGKKNINFSQISGYLPRFEYISSSEYKQPDSLIQRTLQGVVDSVIRPTDEKTDKSILRPELVNIQDMITQALNHKINEITDILKRFYPTLQSVQVDSNIDFLKSFTTANLMLDLGDGPRFLNTFGEGTKKKVWMCLLDWQKQIQQEENIAVFRVYDEPDINLDYSAERKLFLSIIESVNSEDSRVQSIVSTHSVTLIDRAPIESIRLIKVKNESLREIEFFDGNHEDSIPFMFNIGSSVGISNSLILYEKAFLVVEGESEEGALPILYKNIYGRSLFEDGIVLVNLCSYSSWKTTLKFLGCYRAEITVILLDTDCKNTNEGSRLTGTALEELNYPPDFIHSNCFYIGSKEFEDAFHNDDLIATLNEHYPKDNSELWENEDIEIFRKEKYKFANDLIQFVRRNCVTNFRSSMTKPEFATKLALQCLDSSQIPSTLRDVFQLLRQKAGVAVISAED
jgi:predicted ATP-dependent endonuclease of OLD family